MLSIALIVATFGDADWKDLGDRTMTAEMARHGGTTVRYLRWHSAETLAGARNGAAMEVVERYGVDYLCFLDADDSLPTGYFDTMRDAAHIDEMNRLDSGDGVIPPRIFVPDVIYLDRDGEVLDGPVNLYDRQRDPDGHPRPLLEINHAVIGSLIPARLFLDVGGFEPEWPIYEDWQCWLKMERAGAVFVQTSDVLRLDAARRAAADGEGRDTPGETVAEAAAARAVPVYEIRRRPESRNFSHPGLHRSWYQRIQNLEIGAREQRISPYLRDRAEADA